MYNISSNTNTNTNTCDDTVNGLVVVMRRKVKAGGEVGRATRQPD